MKTFLTFTFFIVVIFTNAQTNRLRVNPNIALPQDTTERNMLLGALNEFLVSAQLPNEDNKFVLATEKLETYILLDEFKGIEKSGKFKDDNFFKPYLINVSPLADQRLLVQVSYLGVSDTTALTRATFELIAHRANGSFSFSSPLIRNTRDWKVEKVNNNIFHFQNSINKGQLKKFQKMTAAFDAKLNAEDKITAYYCTADITELQRLIGVQYKADYNGRTEAVFSASSGNRKLIVLGDGNASFDNFDTHDLFHDRLSLVIARSKVNRPVDEGCAYLYGGSWGMTWPQIFDAFKNQVASNKNINWLDVKENPVYFKTKEFNNSADYIVNALLIKKIEKEKGFAGVWELLNVGPVEKGNEKYFASLEKLTGITKASYNQAVWELVNAEK